MSIKDVAFKVFGKRQDAEKPAGPYARSAGDPGIVLADDFAAAAMIRENGVRLVKIGNQSFESTPLLQKINRPEFFLDLGGLVRKAILNDGVLSMQGYHRDEVAAAEAMVHDHFTIKEKLASVNLKLLLNDPAIHTAFQGETGMLSTASRWHTDAGNVLSVCLDGTGTEYLEGVPTSKDRQNLYMSDDVSGRLKIRTTGPGDIIVMHGREVFCDEGRNTMIEDISSAQFHRSGSLSRRAVMLYPLGLE
jgi:hypothetical protein